MTTELLTVSVAGEGSPVVLLHGLFGSSDNLGRVALELEQDYQVWRVDLRNHGRSFHNDEMNYSVMVEDLARTMRDKGINKAHMIGHSMGGKVAMKFSLMHPEMVLSLIIADISPVRYPPHHHKILEGLTSLDLDKVASRKDADIALAKYIDEIGVRQFLLKSLEFSSNLQAKWKFNLKAIITHYAEILDGCFSEQPFLGKTLFIAGGASDYIKAEHRDTTMALFPNTELKIIPEASHWLHAEKPRIFIGICQRFLKESSKGI